VNVIGKVGHASSDYVVEASVIAGLLDPHIERAKQRYLGEEDETVGVLRHIADEYANLTGTSPETAARALYRIRSGEVKAIGAELAEHFLFAVEDCLSDYDIPVYPASKKGAAEMAEAWCEDWSELEQARFAKTLYNFTRGFFSDEKVEDSDLYVLLQETRAA
jgi:hypothetical protein